MLDTCKHVYRRKNIEQTQINNSIAEIKWKSIQLLKSNGNHSLNLVQQEKTAINLPLIFHRNLPLSNFMWFWTNKKS